MRYNYDEAVKNDVEDWIENNKSVIPFDDFEDAEDMKEWLNDRLWDEDSVTGNGSGSYWCNTYEAEEALCHNWDLLNDILDEFGHPDNILDEGAEWCDVTIRCYLLSQIISEVVDERYDNN